MITLPMVISDLKPYICSPFEYPKLFRELRGIYLADGESADDPSILYIGSAENIARMLIRGAVAENCILISAGTSETLQNAPRRNVILIITTLPLTTLHNRLSQGLLYCDEWKNVLTRNAGKGIKPFLQTASRYFEISICLLTSNLRPAIRSIQENDEAFMNFSSREFLENPDSPFQLLIDQLDHSKQNTVVSTPRRNGYVFALIPVTRNHTVLGYLLACTSNRTSLLENILYVMAPLAAELMLEDDWYQAGKDTFQSLAAQFLGDSPEDLDVLERKLKQLPNHPKRFMRGIIIRTIDDTGQPLPIYPQEFRRMFHDIQAMFPLDNTALLDECIYIMSSDERPDSPITITENEAFCALLQQYHAYAMVSNPSQRLQGVRVLFHQCFHILPAAVAIRFDDEQELRCLRFDRYAPYYIIRLCEQAASREMGVNDILYLCHPAILTLTRYDRAYNSNLRDTLFTFLMNDRSISETSRKMFMHRNTTIYKLNKIQELINDNLENPYTRHQLILSCMIIRYVEQYQHSTFQLPPLESSLLRK